MSENYLVAFFGLLFRPRLLLPPKAMAKMAHTRKRVMMDLMVVVDVQYLTKTKQNCEEIAFRFPFLVGQRRKRVSSKKRRTLKFAQGVMSHLLVRLPCPAAAESSCVARCGPLNEQCKVRAKFRLIRRGRNPLLNFGAFSRPQLASVSPWIGSFQSPCCRLSHLLRIVVHRAFGRGHWPFLYPGPISGRNGKIAGAGCEQNGN